MIRSVVAASAAIAALALPASAQTRTLLVDFGSPGHPTAGAPRVWNNVPSTQVGTHPLVDDAGASSPVVLTFDADHAFAQHFASGVQVPAAGSELEQLAWPASAMRDGLFSNDAGEPLVEMTLSGLDPAATYDLTLLTSRFGGSAARTTLCEIRGVQTPEAILEARDNDAEVVVVKGVRPDVAGRIFFDLSADRTNTSSSGFFCLNVLAIDEHAAGSQPPLLAFGVNRYDVSRRIGAGVYLNVLDLYTNDGTIPFATLTPIDDATGAPPTWLSIPGATLAGPFLVLVDEGALGVGEASATVTVSAAGYAPGTATFSLRVRPTDGYRNLLYYGNSYSERNGGVGAVVEAMAEEAGFEPPNTVERFVGGASLAFHLNDADQQATIADELPFGEEWDFVVLQGQSLEATTLGNPSALAANAGALVDDVRAHSPSAVACLFETWARGPGHAVYQGGSPTYASPLAMQADIEAGYALARSVVEAAHGTGAARVAAVGDGLALQAFAASLYEPDLSHPAPATTALAAAVLFTSIYGHRACELAPDFGAPSTLGSALAGLGVSSSDWAWLSGYADRAAEPHLRLFPGSGEDLLLRTAVNGPLDPCPSKPAGLGNLVSAALTSPAGSYHGPAAFLYLDVFPTAAPPGPWAAFPEVRLSPLSAFPWTQTGSLTSAGLSFLLFLPASVPGFSVGVQGFAFGPSSKTGNPFFTTTDVHELRMQ